MQDERSASDRLKARLTGAVALLILGAVGWFWLLDADSPVDTVAQESAIPAVPEIKPFTVAQPQPPEGIKPVGSEQNAEVVADPVEPIAVAAAVAQAESKPVVVEKSVAKPAPAPKPQPAPVPKTQTKPAPEKLQLDTNNLPVAWVVQVGAMSTQASADKLKQQLIAKGFKAYTQPGKLANGSAVIKVFVGPKLSRERADAQKKAIDAALKTNTMVVRFPTN